MLAKQGIDLDVEIGYHLTVKLAVKERHLYILINIKQKLKLIIAKMEVQKEDLIHQRATSINRLSDEIKKETERARCQAMTARFNVKLCWEEFLTLFTDSANYVLQNRGLRGGFMVDNNNRYIIEQLWLYMSYNEAFEGDLHKGLMLQGAVGVGKSLLMESYMFLQNRLAHRVRAPNGERFKGVQFIHASEIAERIKSADNGVRSLSKQTLIIDDIGRESKQVMDFGNVTCPMAELIAARADSAVITHGTTNYNLTSLSSDALYGPMIGDRIRAMFNFMTVGGTSRRA